MTKENDENKNTKGTNGVMIETAQALKQGGVEAHLTDGDDDEGTLTLKVEYDRASRLSLAAIENIESMIRQFDQFRYGRAGSKSEEI